MISLVISYKNDVFTIEMIQLGFLQKIPLEI